MNLLNQIVEHFEAIKPFEVKVPTLGQSLFIKPPSMVQLLKVGSIRELPADKQAFAWAENIVDLFHLADGRKAFPFDGVGMNPVETLVKKAAPVVFTALINGLGEAVAYHNSTLDELEKK